MKIYRNSNGFTLAGKYQVVRVEIENAEDGRWALVYESKESPIYPTWIQPFNDTDLYRVAYKYASRAARYEFHPRG